MKIESTDDDYNYLSALYQESLKVQSTSSSSEQTADSSGSGKVSLKTDSLEISSNAYAAYSDSAKGTSGSSVTQSTTEAFDSLLSDGTITSDQESAIASALAAPVNESIS